MSAATTATTVAAMVTLGGCPPGSDDCHHPGLPHIGDCTSSPPWCHATADGGATRCTLHPLHGGPHLAGNGDWIVTAWEQDPRSDWAAWAQSDGTAARRLAVLSWVCADGDTITCGGFAWSPPHERDLMPAAAVAAYEREVANTEVPARVRLVHLPVPAQIAQFAADTDPSVRQVVTDWIESRLDEVEVTAPAARESIITPDDPEPRVQVTVQKQYTNRRGYDVDAAEPEHHEVNVALRGSPRATVAALRDADYTSDEFVLAHGWLGDHRGGFYARFDGDWLFDDEDEADGTPGSIARWLAWSDRWRQMLGGP